MSAHPPSTAQLRQMIEERLAELRRALAGMEATGDYDATAREMHQALLAEIESLERQVRDVFTDR